MARYSPGQSGNVNGRPRGSRNKIVGNLKQELSEFALKEWPRLKREFRNLDTKDQFTQFEKILPYLIPRQREEEINLSVQNLSSEQLDDLFDRIIYRNNSKTA